MMVWIYRSYSDKNPFSHNAEIPHHHHARGSKQTTACHAVDEFCADSDSSLAQQPQSKSNQFGSVFLYKF